MITHKGKERDKDHLRKFLGQHSGMKVFLVLAVAVFAGCHANILWQDQAKSNMDMVKDAFWDYVAKATLTADDIVQKIKDSELGQEVNTRISESADALGQYAVSVRGQVTPLTQDLLEKMSQESQQLKVRLQQDLSSVKSQLEPYVEELMTDLQQQMEQLKKDVTPYTDAVDPEALKATLLQKSQELRTRMEKTMQEMQSKMGMETEEMKEKLGAHMQDFQKMMAPLTQSSQEMQQNLDPYAQNLKNQLTALWESFSKNSQ